MASGKGYRLHRYRIRYFRFFHRRKENILRISGEYIHHCHIRRQIFQQCFRRYIQDSLDRLAQGRTTITIAHRLSTILGADEIIVLDDEGIKERGNHKELIKLGGLYEKYYRMQLSAI